MNVVQTPEGETYIPASQRPDGTWRKARKVKDGYVPQEEVPLYQSKGRQWAANRPSYPVGLDPELIRASEAKQTTTRVTPVRQAATLSKPLYPVGLDPELIKASEGAKKKKKKQKSTVANTPEVKPDSQENSAAPCQPAGDPVKRLRNLKKKLKEIIALEEKVKTKEVKNLDKDQIEKLSRKSCIEDEIAAIEFENSLKISD